MKTKLLFLLLVCSLTAVCGFAQSETTKSDLGNGSRKPVTRSEEIRVNHLNQRAIHREDTSRSDRPVFKHPHKQSLRKKSGKIQAAGSGLLRTSDVTKQRLDSIVYTYTNYTIDRKGEYSYDSNGNITMEAYYYWENNAWVGDGKEEYSYDSNGNITMEAYCYWENNAWVYFDKEEATYDSSGNLTVVYYRWENNAWVTVSKDEETYDSNGNITMEAYYYWENNTWVERRMNKYEMTYDNKGNITMSAYYYWENNAWVERSRNKYEMTYDNKGNITMSVRYYWENNTWVDDYKYESIYDSNGNITMRAHYYWENNTWVGDYKHESIYDSNGNETMSVYYYWENNTWVEGDRNKYEYDNNGNLILKELDSYMKLEYAYDNHGNQIMFAEYSWDDENNTWIGEEKGERELDLSVFMSDIIHPIDDYDDFLIFTLNKTISVKTYEWIENGWQETGIVTYYYSDMPSSIPNVSTTSISIYPNPISDHFRISGLTENTLITIVDITGKKVLQQTVIPDETVAIGHLPSGVYFANVKGETVRIVKLY